MKTLKCIGLAALSGFLLWIAFFPLDLGPVVFISLVPFLLLVRTDCSRRLRYGSAYLGGVIFFALAIKWVRVAHPMMALFTWPALTLVCACYWPVALAIVRSLDQGRWPLSVTFPVVWVALEYFRMHFPTGFPLLKYLHSHQLVGFGWYSLGYALHDFPVAIQCADLGGVYLVSFCIAIIGGVVAELVVHRRHSLMKILLPLCIPAGLFAYGIYQLQHPAFQEGPLVAALQGSLSQDLKTLRGDQADPSAEPPLWAEYRPLMLEAEKLNPDLVIWPETCFPFDWVEAAPDAAQEEQKVARKVARDFSQFGKMRGITQLIGLNGIVYQGESRFKYNSSLLVDAQGNISGRYDKIHLVPFGEYVPFGKTFPWLSAFTPYKHDYSCTPGESLTRFPLGNYHFGVLICYEDGEPTLARAYNPGAGGEGVDFLVNISNDGWFEGTEQHEEHLAVCQFRAVEARRSVVRAVNMGISGVIDPDGRVVTLPAATWSESKKIRKVVSAKLPLDSRFSLYSRLGDLLPAACWLAIILSFVMRYSVRRAMK